MPRRVLAVLTAAVLTASALVALGPTPHAAADTPSPPPMKDSTSNMVSADQLPTVQIDDGVVWSQVMIGNIVYVAGNFSNARPFGAAKGTNLTARNNLLAYNITTGDLVSGFAPDVNGQVRVITKSPDGSRLYIGGDFTKVNGTARYLVAALKPSDGSLVAGFNAAVGGSFVNAIAATNSTVYLGGLFTAANGTARANLAAYSSSGALLNWTPSADLEVDAMVLTPDNSRVIIGGRFGNVNGATQRGLAALDPSTGTTIPWAATKDIRNGISTGSNAGKAGIYSLATDGQAVYGTGWGFADVNTGNLEGAFSAAPDSGDINWVEDCHGDTYSVYSDSSTVYTLSHAHYCGAVGGYPQSEPDWGVNMRHALAFTPEATGTLAHDQYAGGTYQDWYGTPGPSMINWFPDFYTGKFTGMGQAAWSVTGNGDYLSIGGEFPGVNGKAQYGLVRFAKKSITTPKQGPRLSGSDWPITLNTSAKGIARVSFSANWDRDNMKLTYKLIRDGDDAHPVAQKTVTSTFWDTPTVGLIDSTASAGSHTYKVIVSDPDGNSVTSQSVTGSVTAGMITAYPLKVLNDDASLYWRLGDSSGSTASDLAGSDNGNIESGVTLGTTGAITDDPDTAASFDGSNSGYIAADDSITGPNTFTATAWFKTSSNRGGKILGFGGSKTGSSSNYDRHVYLDNSGHVIFGVYPGSVQTIQSSDTYNDGEWHQVAASLGSDGMHLYVDGQQVAARTDVTTAQSYSGYWRVGGDNLGSWTSAPSSYYLNGSIDEFAVFDSVLGAGDIEDLYTLGTGGTPNAAPTAAFSSDTDKLKVSVDGSDSTDADGSVASYAWDWGDDSAAGSGKTASHTYDEAGDYTVKLTVTDNDGATDSITHTVTVAANEAPTAAFSSDTDKLMVSVDATDSTDADGSIASYAWDWGDESAAGSGKSASHTYDEAGDYTVKLTVTDNDGATDSITHKVTVTAANQTPTAAFTSSTDGLDLSVDGSGSADADGTVTSYTWDWGDSTSDGSGKTATHSYASGGTYTVKLTVTDDDGATDSVTHSVTVAKSTTGTVAQDSFTRTQSSGWGTADEGGPWSVRGSAGDYTVSGGTGNMIMSQIRQSDVAQLAGVSARDVSITTQVSFDKRVNGGGSYVYLTGRKTTSSEEMLKLQLTASGSVVMTLSRLDGSGETILTSATVPGVSADDTLDIRFQIEGTSPATLSGRVWKASDTEPTAWLKTATDNSASAQLAGAVSLRTYVSGTATNLPTTASFDNFAVSAVSTGGSNEPPTAAFNTSADDLAVAADGTGSTDPDGSISSYTWDWGDNTAAGSGVTATHTYAATGTYTVKLTVTDNGGATDSVSHSVTVSRADSALAADTFGRAIASGWGSADTGGAWSTNGSATPYSVDNGVGKITLAQARQSGIVDLQGVSARDLVLTSDVQLDRTPNGNGGYVYFVARRSSTGEEFLKLQFAASGAVVAQLSRLDGGAESVMATLTVPNVTATDKLKVRFQIVGDGTSSTLLGKVWAASAAEPTNWLLTATDSTAARQNAGSVGVRTYMSGTSTTLPVTVSIDNFSVLSAAAGN